MLSFKIKFVQYFFIAILVLFACKKEDNKIEYDILAKSTSYQDVQDAIDSAKNGDIVLIPAGESEWSSTLLIPDEKDITLKGSGKDATIISYTTSEIWRLITMGLSSSRITEIGFKLGNDNGVGIDASGYGWRVDHCRFENLISNLGATIEGVSVRGLDTEKGCPTGLIDHCEFINTRVLVVGDAGLMANKIWAEPLGLGTNNAVFVEDCFFEYTQFANAIDANYGARYVFRYNIVNDAYLEAHSLQSTSRATRSWEIYNNTINQVNREMWTPFSLRGGTGVVFNNTITGIYSLPNIVVDNRRSFEALGEGGICDGASPWDGNEEANGYPARDQIGRSTDQWIWTVSNPYPPQELDPFYQWNNTHNGTTIDVYVHNNCGIHIKENRDYYNNTERPNYTPFQYPHPLNIE